MLIKRSHRLRDDQLMLIKRKVKKKEAHSIDGFIREAIDDKLTNHA